MKEIRDIKIDMLMGNDNPIIDLFNEITDGIKIMNCLYKSDCYDTPDDAYIAGLCNLFPSDLDKPRAQQRQFLFINKIRIGRSYKDVLLIMHESMHLSLEVHGHNLKEGDIEEKVITYAESTATEICEELKGLGILNI